MKIKNPGQYTVYDGDDVVKVVGTGKGVVIRQSGGEVWTYGKSAPVIIMTTGLVRTFGSSAPVIHKKKLNTKPGDRRKDENYGNKN